MHPFIEMQDFFAQRAAGWEDFVKKEWLAKHYQYYYALLASGIPATQAPIEILDLGCGGGIEFEWILQRAPNARVTGVDQSPRMLDCLRKKYADRLDQFNLIQDSYLTCALEEEGFDFVVTSMSVHYFRPPIRREVYKRIHRSLIDDGSYIEGTYCVTKEEEQKGLSNFERSAAGLEGADSGRFKVNLPLHADTISALLNDAGFPVVEWPDRKDWVVIARKR